MKIIRSSIFSRFPEIAFGLSTKVGLERKAPFYFNMSFSVGDIPVRVRENRKAFFTELGLNGSRVVTQKQVHGDIIKIVNAPGTAGECDAMITSEKNLALAVSTADCSNIYIYDQAEKVIAGIHSGWRGTAKKILSKTLNKIKAEFDSQPDNLFVYFGPAISQRNYEVGEEVARFFDSKYSIKKDGKYFLDVTGINYDLLIEFGVPAENIEVSKLCSFENKYLQSYRRDGTGSGRAFGVIMMKGVNEE